MKSRQYAITLVMATMGMATMASAVVLDHTATNTITAGNSVSCNNGIQTNENSYYWALDLTNYGLGAGFDVTGGSFGVESATAPTPYPRRLSALS